MLLLVISPSVNSVDSSLVRGSLYLCNLPNAVLQSGFVITLSRPQAVGFFVFRYAFFEVTARMTQSVPIMSRVEIGSTISQLRTKPAIT